MIRAEVRAWVRDTGFEELTAEARKELAYRLLAQALSEDKLAGVILLREHRLDLLGPGDLPALASLFDAGHIADWSACDWLCVRVLAALVRRDGRPVAERIAAWTAASALWRRRAAAVALAPLAPEGEGALEGFTHSRSPSATRTCAATSDFCRPAWDGCCGSSPRQSRRR